MSQKMSPPGQLFLYMYASKSSNLLHENLYLKVLVIALDETTEIVLISMKKGFSYS